VQGRHSEEVEKRGQILGGSLLAHRLRVAPADLDVQNTKLIDRRRHLKGEGGGESLTSSTVMTSFRQGWIQGGARHKVAKEPRTTLMARNVKHLRKNEEKKKGLRKIPKNCDRIQPNREGRGRGTEQRSSAANRCAERELTADREIKPGLEAKLSCLRGRRTWKKKRQRSSRPRLRCRHTRTTGEVEGISLDTKKTLFNNKEKKRN